MMMVMMMKPAETRQRKTAILIYRLIDALRLARFHELLEACHLMDHHLIDDGREFVRPARDVSSDGIRKLDCRSAGFRFEFHCKCSARGELLERSEAAGHPQDLSGFGIQHCHVHDESLAAGFFTETAIRFK